ncbi:MAG: hypothetical protein ACAI43_03035 [Phycisphaerae bacterium]|nr:hypothetical protein [Tepidisphaeraceae bacterium]
MQTSHASDASRLIQNPRDFAVGLVIVAAAYSAVLIAVRAIFF